MRPSSRMLSASGGFGDRIDSFQQLETSVRQGFLLSVTSELKWSADLAVFFRRFLLSIYPTPNLG